MKFTKLYNGVQKGKVVYEGDWERDIETLVWDSRERIRNGLFFCLTGGVKDGHEFAEEAIRNGAVVLVVERILKVSVPQILVEDTREALALYASAFYGNPSENLKIIAITGTNGKTTTAHMLASILHSAGKKVGVIGTLGVRYLGNYLSSELTTPDPVFLHKILAKMWLDGVEYVVMEASAHALYYRKMAGIKFSACIFTNFTQDHLDFFKTMASYKEAKSRLFSSACCPISVINGDDETGRALGEMREENQAKNIYYGLYTPSDAFAIITDENLKGIRCIFNVNDAIARISLSFIGRHNVYNALASVTCAVALGISMEDCVQGINCLRGVDGRLERIGSINGADIFVDFAHTPDGLEKSLSSLKAHASGRLICLFGCGGNRDKGKRPLMGAVAAKKCAFSVLTSDNPRYEDPLDIIADIEKGYRRYSSKYVVVPDRTKALEYAIGYLREGDILLVAGKGGERYQEIMGIKYPLYDNDIIEKVIKTQTVIQR